MHTWAIASINSIHNLYYLLFCIESHFISLFLEFIPLIGSTPQKIKKGKQLEKTLPTWGPDYEISFDIKIHSWINSWGSILRFAAIDGNYGKMGQRYPSLWTKYRTKDRIHLATIIDDNPNYSNDKLGAFKRNKWYNFVISQQKDEVLLK